MLYKKWRSALLRVERLSDTKKLIYHLIRLTFLAIVFIYRF